MTSLPIKDLDQQVVDHIFQSNDSGYQQNSFNDYGVTIHTTLRKIIQQVKRSRTTKTG